MGAEERELITTKIYYGSSQKTEKFISIFHNIKNFYLLIISTNEENAKYGMG